VEHQAIDEGGVRGGSGAATGDGGPWHRLHPLSPVTRLGRLVPVIVLYLAIGAGSKNHNPYEGYYLAGLAGVGALLGFISWRVTRWRLEGDVLHIETGLLRRDSKRLPLARIQAVDLVRPLLARIFGLAEVRIRLAGSSRIDGRLSFLADPAATALRDRLMRVGAGTGQSNTAALTGDAAAAAGAVAIGPEQGTRAPVAEHVMASVSGGRLVLSVLLSGLAFVVLLLIVILIVLAFVSPAAAGAFAGFLAVYALSFFTALWRRVSGEFNFEAVEAPEGIRVRRGLLETVSETIPFGRIQAVRKIEPLLWRPLGWCRLEVDLAGAVRQGGGGSSVARKALLPVGREDDAWHLIDRVIGGPLPRLDPPPSRAKNKAPLSYHFLAAGHDTARAGSVTGRLRKVTAWVPIEKVQSIRRVQGPVQRRLGLATVHVDVAGRRTRAQFRDRDAHEADQLVEDLTTLARAARRQRALPSVQTAPDLGAAIPSGWYPDPSGRHQLRYWRGEWTEQVSDGGTVAVDPP
jgi:putative membrane protein